MSGRRVLIVSASMGAGHDAAARVIAGGLGHRGAEVTVVDLLRLGGERSGSLLRGFYRNLVGRAPSAYGMVMNAWAAQPRFFERVTAIGSGHSARGLMHAVRANQPDVIVTTYNLAAQLVGRAKRAAKISVPAVSYVTDPGAHPYWVAAGIDVHAAPLAVTAQALARLGADGVRVVAPAVDSRFRQVEHRPADGRCRVLVNGGSWGVGDAARTAREIVAAGASPRVLCGRSRALHRAVADVVGAEAIDWTDDVPDVLADIDVLVDNAGGTTCWESIAAGVPVIVHRPIPGHGRLNARALSDAGLARWTATADDLAIALRHAARPRAASVFDQPSVADVVASMW